MRQQIDGNHRKIRSVLRVVGPIVVGIGLVLIVIGMGSFFAAFGGSGPPRYFWCAFVGVPLLGVGGMICQFAFMGRVARYYANEVTPVGKDAFNYMADGTKGAVRDLAGAIGEGLRSGGAEGVERLVRCHKCNADNDAHANFCDGCGSAMKKSMECPDCHELNDPDARFCDNCGEKIG